LTGCTDSETLLGSGAFGIVHRGHVKRNNIRTPVAIKTINAIVSTQKILNELKVLSKIGVHGNVAHFLGYSLDQAGKY